MKQRLKRMWAVLLCVICLVPSISVYAKPPVNIEYTCAKCGDKFLVTQENDVIFTKDKYGTEIPGLSEKLWSVNSIYEDEGIDVTERECWDSYLGLCPNCTDEIAQAYLANPQPQEEIETVTVTASIANTYSVNIPKTITLDPTTKSADFTVSVTGDLAVGNELTIVNDETFKMSTKGKDDVTATVTIDKNSWTLDDMTDASGTITASGLTAGDWNGTFEFKINLSKKPVDIILNSSNFKQYTTKQGN